MSDLADLVYGAVRTPDGRRFAVARAHDRYLDLAGVDEDLFAAGTLDAFLAAGRPTWQRVNEAAAATLAAADDGLPEGAVPVLPFAIADYVDCYAFESHASNVGRIFRPDSEALTPNWKHLPIGYHGRAGTIVVSGTEIRRPSGQAKQADGTVAFGPSTRLDIEAEVAFVVGMPSEPGRPVPPDKFAEHVFGVALLNDWSARDIQAWEYVPLGPMLGKSFATSLAAWITPLDVLANAWTDPPPQDPVPLQHLAEPATKGLELALTVSINDTTVSTPPFAAMYWTPAQLISHLTSNGAHLRTGDVIASGTVSGPDPRQRGCLLELTWAGRDPITLADGSTRTFLADGDEVVITASAPGLDGRVALGEVRGRVRAGSTSGSAS